MKHKTIYLIGLTGGIACGKSTVLNRLTELGAQTIDADKVTHQVQQPGAAVYEQIVAAFGQDILQAPGRVINRQKLGQIVFGDPAQLKRLEQIVHPAVRAQIFGFLEAASSAAAQSGQRQVVVIDAIKLIEAGWTEQCDQVWVIICSEAQQIARLMETRGMSEAEARQRIAAQVPQESRLAYANVVIDNSGSLEATLAQIDRAWQGIGSM